MHFPVGIYNWSCRCLCWADSPGVRAVDRRSLVSPGELSMEAPGSGNERGSLHARVRRPWSEVVESIVREVGLPHIGAFAREAPLASPAWLPGPGGVRPGHMKPLLSCLLFMGLVRMPSGPLLHAQEHFSDTEREFKGRSGEKRSRSEEAGCPASLPAHAPLVHGLPAAMPTTCCSPCRAPGRAGHALGGG